MLGTLSVRQLAYSENGYVLTIDESKGLNHNYDVILSGRIQGSRMLQPKVKLLAAFEAHRPRLYIEDLQGNGYSSGTQGQGIGTLLFNTALLIFQRDYPPEMAVYGELSDVGDPTDPALAQECRERREGFWSSFGFTVVPGGRLGTTITALLGNLRPKTQDVRIHERFPRYVELERFRAVGCGEFTNRIARN